MALVPMGLVSVLSGDIIIILMASVSVAGDMMGMFIRSLFILFPSVASVPMGLVSILSGDHPFLLIFIILFSVASMNVLDGMMVILAGLSFILILVLVAVAFVAEEVGPGLI